MEGAEGRDRHHDPAGQTHLMHTGRIDRLNAWVKLDLLNWWCHRCLLLVINGIYRRGGSYKSIMTFIDRSPSASMKA